MSYWRLAVAGFGLPLGSLFDLLFHDVETHRRAWTPEGPSLFFKMCFVCGVVQIAVIAAAVVTVAVN